MSTVWVCAVRLLFLALVTVLASSCGSSSPDLSSLPSGLVEIADADVERRKEAVLDSLSDSQRRLTADGEVSRADVETATASAQVCIGERVQVELPGTIVEFGNTTWSPDGLYFDLRYRIGLPGGATEPDFSLIDSVDELAAECSEEYRSGVAELYLLDQVPVGAERIDEFSSLEQCLGRSVHEVLAAPTSSADLACLEQHSALFVAVNP